MSKENGAKSSTPKKRKDHLAILARHSDPQLRTLALVNAHDTHPPREDIIAICKSDPDPIIRQIAEGNVWDLWNDSILDIPYTSFNDSVDLFRSDVETYNEAKEIAGKILKEYTPEKISEMSHTFTERGGWDDLCDVINQMTMTQNTEVFNAIKKEIAKHGIEVEYCT